MDMRKTLPRPTWSHMMRDHYKEQYLREAKQDRKKEFNYRRGIIKRSIQKFSNGPFARNLAAQSEINEHNSEIFNRRQKKKLNKTIPRRKSEENSNNKLLSKLRKEIILIETNERRLEAALASDKYNNKTAD